MRKQSRKARVESSERGASGRAPTVTPWVLEHHTDALGSNSTSVQDEEQPSKKRVTWRHGREGGNQVLCLPLGCNLLTKFKFLFLLPWTEGKVLLEAQVSFFGAFVGSENSHASNFVYISKPSCIVQALHRPLTPNTKQMSGQHRENTPGS